MSEQQPATQPEAPAGPQQPATAPLSDAQGQREQLRERIAFVLHDTDCSGCAEDPTVVDRYYRLADAVLTVRDEELADYRNTLDKALREREEAERKYDELYVGQGARNEQLREGIAQAIGDPGSILPRKNGQSVPRWSADAVLTLRDDDLERFRQETGADDDDVNAWIERTRAWLDEAWRQRERAETAEAGLVESNWPDGGPGDDPPEVKLAKMRQRAETAEEELSLAKRTQDETHIWNNVDFKQRAEDAEQERDNLREHVDADHQVLSEVRHHADRLREWCRDPDATVTIAGSICADLQKTLNGDNDG